MGKVFVCSHKLTYYYYCDVIQCACLIVCVLLSTGLIFKKKKTLRTHIKLLFFFLFRIIYGLLHRSGFITSAICLGTARVHIFYLFYIEFT